MWNALQMWRGNKSLANVTQLLGISPIEVGVTFLSVTFALQLLIDLYAYGGYQRILLVSPDAHQFS